MPALPHIFFDAVGTLIHLREPVGTTYARFATAAGWRVDPVACESAFRRVMSATPPPRQAASEGEERGWWRHIVGATLAGAGAAPGNPLESWFDTVFDHFGSADAWEVYPEVPEVLGDLAARGCRLHILSNFDHRLPGLLHSLGLADRFTTITSSHSAGYRKPAPEIFALAARAATARTRECLLAGDDPVRDIRAAEECGWRHFRVHRPAGDLRPLPRLFDFPS